MKRATIRLRKLFKVKDKHINLSPRLSMIVSLATQVTEVCFDFMCSNAFKLGLIWNYEVHIGVSGQHKIRSRNNMKRKYSSAG